MMSASLKTSQKKEAYLWAWLPGETEPIPCGRLFETSAGRYAFNYGKGYLKNPRAFSLYNEEFPLISGVQQSKLSFPGCIRDASPDAWGRRVVLNAFYGANLTDSSELSELTYLLHSGSDRIGALDFQESATHYVGRDTTNATLMELYSAATKVELGLPLNHDLESALFYGTALGGARPKALIQDANKKLIAKFSSFSDLFNVAKSEFVAMRLAKVCGLSVADVQLTEAYGRDVLLVHRFDRTAQPKGYARRHMLSVLTLLNLDPFIGARYASYEDFAQILRAHSRNFARDLKELFSRMVFNILCGNSDDHAKNHCVYYDGAMIELTPAYDICPQSRSGEIASQSMLIFDQHRESTLENCRNACKMFRISESDALGIISLQVETIAEHFDKIADEVNLSPVDRRMLRTKQFLNPYCFYDLKIDSLSRTGEKFRGV